MSSKNASLSVRLVIQMAVLACTAVPGGGVLLAAETFQAVRDAESRRIETIARVAPAVVCVFDQTRDGGGAGVLIDEEGYGLTNFHVVMNMLETRRGFGGLSDGKIYTLEVLGIDVTGDVAMFKLDGPDDFPAAPLGDSAGLRLGQRVLAMGNPFALAYDYTPTVTLGVITGLHRYQYGRGNALVYTDCIQTDAAINPGNSGGPLFDLAGQIVGINGRASFEQRGRVNVGLAYAISINQIRRFIPALRAGLLVEHGSLGATLGDASGGGVEIDRIVEKSPASAAGVQLGDRLLAFDDVPITSANQFASLLGTYPADWPVSLSLQRGEKKWETQVRLEPQPVQAKDTFEVDVAANRRAAKRVLTKARSQFGVGKNATATPVVEYRSNWTNTEDEASRVIVVRSERGGELTVTTLGADNEPVSVRSTDGRDAWMLIGDQTEDLAGFKANVLRLEHAFHHAVLFAESAADKWDWRHVGGDRVQGKIAEVVEASQDGTVVRFAFAAETFLPLRGQLLTEDGGTTTVIRFEAFRNIHGRVLPTRLEGYENGQRKCHWRIAPGEVTP